VQAQSMMTSRPTTSRTVAGKQVLASEARLLAPRRPVAKT
jgi:hypothetical protein